MISARLFSAAVFALASTLSTEALPQVGSGMVAAVGTTTPPGHLNVTLTSPSPLAVNKTATAAVTFHEVPDLDSGGVVTFVNCEIRAPELGGDRGGAKGFIAPCTFPGPDGIALSEFKKQIGGTVKIDLRDEWRGGKQVTFHVFVTSGPNSGNPFAQANGGTTAPFDIAA